LSLPFIVLSLVRFSLETSLSLPFIVLSLVRFSLDVVD